MDLVLEKINSAITDRTNVFYWQTDRKITPEEASHVWSNRHSRFNDDQIIQKVNQFWNSGKLASLVPFDPSATTSLGSINLVRIGNTDSGEQVIIRCHPKGVLNGYFYSESLAARLAKHSGLPAYETILVHDLQADDDLAFQIIEKLPGISVQHWIKQHPGDKGKLVAAMGRTLAEVNKIPANGFGSFDNKLAAKGRLQGLHRTLSQFMQANLACNLEVLEKEGMLANSQCRKITSFFQDTNPLLADHNSYLIHNDYADWNLITDGTAITGILDWDECVAGDPVMDIACWSTFFEPGRLAEFLSGYWMNADKPNNFQEKFELFRLRYVISKLTLRIRRYTWDKKEAVRLRIENGKKHLLESVEYYGI